MFRLNFGDLTVAEKSAKQVRFIHDKVFGTLHPTPLYEENSEYSANHQGAIIWVWATLAETALLMFELLVRKLNDEEKEEYYKDQKEFVRFFGVEPSEVPKNWNSFMEYNAKMWNSEILAVSETARENDDKLFSPRSFLVKYANKITRPVTFALLPPKVAKGFHVDVGNFDYFLLYSFFGFNRMIYSSLPNSSRHLTSSIEAEKRIKGCSTYNETLVSISAWCAGIILRNLIMNPSQSESVLNDSLTKNIDSVSVDVQ